MISSVIFDLDDTLCDYRGAKERGLRAVTAAVSRLGVSEHEFLARYHDLEPALFRQFADGGIGRDEYRRRRFEAPLDMLASVPKGLAAELNATYMSIANGDARLFDDVRPTIDQLNRAGIECAVLTNGPSDGQRHKLRCCRLDQMPLRFFISEEIGHAKPAPEAFLTVARALRHDPSSMLMVGDSLRDDVQGARSAGLRSVLIERHETRADFDGERVSNLRDLLAAVAQATA